MIAITCMSTQETYEGSEIKRTSKAVCYRLGNGKILWVPNKAICSNSTNERIFTKTWFTPQAY